MKKIAQVITVLSLSSFFCSFVQMPKGSDSYMQDWECPCKANKKKKPPATPEAPKPPAK